MLTVNNRKAIILQKDKGFNILGEKVFDNRHKAIKYLKDYEPREELAGHEYIVALLDKNIKFEKQNIDIKIS